MFERSKVGKKTMQISYREVGAGVDRMGFGGNPVMVHGSLASFGNVRGGAPSILRGLLDRGRTVMVPAFSSSFGIPRPEHLTPLAQNGVEPGFRGPTGGVGRAYTPKCGEVDGDMGAVATALVGMPVASRGVHPLNSFAAVGPMADALVSTQTLLDVYAPIRELAARGGFILLMGVELQSMTALHAAEELAGRRLFRRWANDPDGQAATVVVGGCSRGFGTFAEILAGVERRDRVGNSLWKAFPARDVLSLCAAAIRKRPELTRCDQADCVRCTDAIAGGPV